MAYVYCHIKADDDQPFYVGIGRTSHRAFDKRSRSAWHRRTVEKHGLRVYVIAEVETWDLAQEWERRWIKALKVAGYALVNQTPGGDGGPTWLGRKHTEETKAKIAFGNLGNKGNTGKIFSEEHRRHLSEAQIGNKKALGYHHTEDAKKNISFSMSGKQHALGFKHDAIFVERSRRNKQNWWDSLSEERRIAFKEKIRLSWIKRRES